MNKTSCKENELILLRRVELESTVEKILADDESFIVIGYPGSGRHVFVKQLIQIVASRDVNAEVRSINLTDLGRGPEEYLQLKKIITGERVEGLEAEDWLGAKEEFLDALEERRRTGKGKFVLIIDYFDTCALQSTQRDFVNSLMLAQREWREALSLVLISSRSPERLCPPENGLLSPFANYFTSARTIWMSQFSYEEIADFCNQMKLGISATDIKLITEQIGGFPKLVQSAIVAVDRCRLGSVADVIKDMVPKIKEYFCDIKGHLQKLKCVDQRQNLFDALCALVRGVNLPAAKDELEWYGLWKQNCELPKLWKTFLYEQSCSEQAESPRLVVDLGQKTIEFNGKTKNISTEPLQFAIIVLSLVKARDCAPKDLLVKVRSVVECLERSDDNSFLNCQALKSKLNDVTNISDCLRQVREKLESDEEKGLLHGAGLDGCRIFCKGQNKKQGEESMPANWPDYIEVQWKFKGVCYDHFPKEVFKLDDGIMD